MDPHGASPDGPNSNTVADCPNSNHPASVDAWDVAMRRGDFAAAWAISDLRRNPASRSPRLPRHQQQVWDGSHIENKSVLVRCYHGLGDTIQFIRYLPLLRHRARHLTLWAQRPLTALLEGCPGVDRLLPLHDGAPEVDYDVDIEIMELPYVFRTVVDTIPALVPYLARHRPPRSQRAARRRVAFAWRAGDWDAARSLPVALAAELVQGLDCDLDVLLPDLLESERRHFTDAGPTDLCATADTLLTADLVVTVDTLFAHLAGALARPTWLLLPTPADWRWMEERFDSPWYPTLRLYRQRLSGDWRDVVARVRIDLDAVLATDPSQAGGVHDAEYREWRHAGSGGVPGR